MKKTLLSLALFSSMLLAEQSYVYIEEGQSAPSVDGTILYLGAPVDIISKGKDDSEVEITGFINKNEPKNLYATKNLKVLIATSKNDIKAQKDGDFLKGSIKTKIKNDMLDDDTEILWESSADTFYETCTQCHRAPDIPAHTMIEWDSLFQSMKAFAKPSEEDSKTILRFLYSHAKDGFVKSE